MLKALVWGCGAIGAGYDWDSPQVLTHAKAYYLNPHFDLTVCDLNPALAEQVANRYEAAWIQNPSLEDLRTFDLVSVCLPTQIHLEALEQLRAAGSPWVLCEKPLVADRSQMTRLCGLGLNPKKVLVNYIRRFQPAFLEWKSAFDSWWLEDPLEQITLHYCRGWLNNGGHAWDLLNFLFGEDIRVIQVRPSLSQGKPGRGCGDETDSFSLECEVVSSARRFHFTAVGLDRIDYPVFQLEMFSRFHHFQLLNSGAELKARGPLWQEGWSRQNALNNYMTHVIEHSLRCIEGRAETNFSSALQVNQQLLDIRERLAL